MYRYNSKGIFQNNKHFFCQSCRPCYVSVVLPAADLHPPGCGDRLLGHYCSVSFHQPFREAISLIRPLQLVLSDPFSGIGLFVTLTPPTRFLSTSNEQIYKVFNNSECPFSRETCDPKVSPTFHFSIRFSFKNSTTVLIL